ncbi:MAG: polysaccharide biosynthesis protein [Verrucomicrobia bacterium]|nr:polysaccharide biosynthesis protein [Verrucomicrobiota bacterium]MBU4292398.1 polysaccharide biosynthesis protein [Verrucomicrobiota bacterium]MBU4429782.1 polysaccharide biosynthesis protein [Verrucomicrobiota bacterium]MBU4497341.1 polysaccharide biosynthesis protein [Verrucomicrobiota bacterium]MCG2679821.1 polysaccharide biosynthesis protein [Kiritimatiellia bacterium]
MRNRYLFLLDVVLLAMTPTLALVMRLDAAAWVAGYASALIRFTILALGVKLATFFLFGLYRRYWRYASVDELVSIFLAVGSAALIVAGLFFGAGILGMDIGRSLPRSVPFIDGLLTLMVIGGTRFSVRVVAYKRRRTECQRDSKAVLIVGAGDAGAMIVREMLSSKHINIDPVGFVDDDPAKQKKSILGLPVLGTRKDIPGLVEKYGVEEVVIAIPTAPGKVVREIMTLCEAAHVPSRTMPGMYEILSGQISVSQLRNVDIEDLLRREPVRINAQDVEKMLSGKRVLVTGAGGSIGSELCRQIARSTPAHLILLGHGENSIFQIENELRRHWPKAALSVVVADIRDQARLAAVFELEKPQVVFHAAAHKHVPMMEANCEDAITNNVGGTRTLVQMAERFGVERFVLISSDKAVNPTNVMGATKRVAEKVVQATAQRTGRPYVAVRFGNVLGSRGSVVPTFREQIARGGPVTITHPDVKRYFMTIPEAVQLVLQAATLASGEYRTGVFVLDMGEPIKIVDLARDLIELSGKQMGQDIEIVFTGLRPGEKLFEELFRDGENYRRTHHEKIFVAAGEPADTGSPAPSGKKDEADLNQLIDQLLQEAERGRPDDVRRLLKEIVPNYTPAVVPPLGL